MRSVALPWPALLAGVWLVAAAARLALLDGPLYGDESAHYAVARGWGSDPDNVVPAYELNSALWWQRPLFSILLSPGAALGIEAYRIEHALLASLLAVLVADVARKAGARTSLAVGAGLVVALHPTFVLWGARVFPDSMMATLVLGGIRAHQSRRALATAGLLLAAVWVKETAAVALLALLAWTIWSGRRRGDVELWPLRLDRPSTALLLACVLAPLPLAHAVFDLGGRLPGWSTTPLSLANAAGFFLTAWLAIPVVVGLVWTRSRPYGLLALAFPLFYVAYALLGHGVEQWYLVAPAALSVLAAAVALDEAGRHASAAVRSTGHAATAVLAAILVVLAVVPDTVTAKGFASPAATPPASLGQLSAQLQGDDLADAVAAIHADQWDLVFLVDLEWFHLDHPFAERAGAVGWATTAIDVPLGEWVRAVEVANVTVLAKQDRPLSLALRDAYADCQQFENAEYVLIAGQGCLGRGEALAEALRSA